MALVSAIMPTYNNASYLQAAIDSILAQTYPDWELIVVDDGSTDHTSDVLAQYSDPRIRCFRLPTNQGRGLARNFALSKCSGKFIAICDSDDISLPNRFSTQVSFLESNTDIAVVSAQLKYFWGDSEPEVRVLYPEDPDAILARLNRGKMGVPHAAAMIRTECFTAYGPYCTECRRAQDLEFFMRIKHTCRFSTLPAYLVLYRHETRGISLRKWVESSFYHRYALYRASLAADATQTPLDFDVFRKNYKVLLEVGTWDMARYVYYTAKTFLARPQSLR